MSTAKDLLCKNLLDDLLSQKYTDCTFVFGDGTIGAHKHILSSISPVFDAMFYGPLKEQGDVVIADIKIEVFRKLIRIAYGDSPEIDSPEEACEIYYAGKKYEMTSALDISRLYMSKHVTMQNVNIFYETAKLFEDPEIVQICCKVLQTDIQNTTKAPNFFTNTLPLPQSNNIHFEVLQNGSTLKLEETLKEHRKNLMAMNSVQDLIDGTLATIRLLVNEIKELFNLMIPRDVALFSCSF